MTEIVQRRMESMTQEFEDMARTNLFSTSESRKVMKKRKEFEYKINGVNKNIQDFKDYIHYEEMILTTIKLRRDKLKIGDKKASLEQNMTTRIKTLYETAIRRFSDDLDLYLQFFKFCKKVNYVHAASTVIKVLLEHFSQNPQSWQVASRWYAYDRKDVNKGIKILYKGIALHKNSKPLYTDIITLEILKNEPKKESQEERSPKQVKVCADKIQTYVKEAIKNIDDYKYFIGLLTYLEDYAFTLSAQNLILDYLLENYTHDAQVKQLLTQRNHQGNEKDDTTEMSTLEHEGVLNN